jgi:hypothetical protein
MKENTDSWLSVNGLIRAVIAGLAGVGVGCITHVFGAAMRLGVITGAVGAGVIVAVLSARNGTSQPHEPTSGVPADLPPREPNSESPPNLPSRNPPPAVPADLPPDDGSVLGESTISRDELERQMRVFIEGLPTPVKVRLPLQLNKLLVDSAKSEHVETTEEDPKQ